MSSKTSGGEAVADTSPRIRVGVSRCLLGEEVRYDGGHKRDRYVVDVLGAYFDCVSVCPEVEIGLPIPRPPIRLVQVGGGIRVRGVRDRELDVTDALDALYLQVAHRFVGLSGFILKRASPSCGMERVKVYDESGRTVGTDAGRFARALMRENPSLPVEEEGRLHDPRLRENFITRVFAYRRWQELRAGPAGVAELQQFHASHKMLLLAHNQAGYRRLGRLVAAARSEGLDTALDAYGEGFMATLRRNATPRSHSNVLDHLAGYLKRSIDAGDRAELREVIDRYRRGLLPLVVPLTLLRHHFRRHPRGWVDQQVYLDPHPAELMLHNHV
ncbi:MAG: DUF1722 domain-containing protein [Deltaproteobacteria bacterium]|nr:DUF1722 domain-containing protein [Deltaproteobacteria bacterium]